MELVRRLYREEDGQGLTEYVLILSLVAIALIASLKIFEGVIETSLNDSAAKLP